MARYRVLVGLNYPPDRRAEAGDLVEDIPGSSIPGLLESGYIERADDKKKASTGGQASSPPAKDAPAGGEG